MFIQVSNFSVVPLFPTTLGMSTIEEDISNLDQIKNLKYVSSPSEGSVNCFVSESLNVFSNFQREKDIVMSYFNKFKNDVLRLENNHVKMTTSWVTKLTTNSSSQFHLHKNSYYSGVLYLEKPKDGGSIEFINDGLNPSSFGLNTPTEYNIFNFESFSIQPQKNLIVFFPSYLKHRITPYRDRDPRYSIAFNIIPVGVYGEGDSTVNISVNT